MVQVHPDPPLPMGSVARLSAEDGWYGFNPSRLALAGRARAGGERSGAVAQLGERLLCKQEVIGSIPFSSTSRRAERRGWKGQE